MEIEFRMEGADAFANMLQIQSKATISGLRRAAKDFQENALPKRFTLKGGRELKYFVRVRHKMARKKLAKMGHKGAKLEELFHQFDRKPPFVQSGNLRRIATKQSKIRKSGLNKVFIKYEYPPYMYKNKKGKIMRDELQRTTEQERKRAARIAGEGYAKFMKKAAKKDPGFITIK